MGYAIKHKVTGAYFDGFDKAGEVQWSSRVNWSYSDRALAVAQAALLRKFEAVQLKPVQVSA